MIDRLETVTGISPGKPGAMRRDTPSSWAPDATMTDAARPVTPEVTARIMELRSQLHAAVSELECARRAVLMAGDHGFGQLAEALQGLASRSATVEAMIDQIEARFLVMSD